jgi:hypothetical protein
LNNAISQRTINILGSILAQAAQLKPELFDSIHVRKPADGLISQAPYTVQEIMSLLQTAMGLFDRFYVLVDALNETPWQLELLAALTKLLRLCPNVRLLVTSTTPPKIDSDDNLEVNVIQMATSHVDHDITEDVLHRLETESAFQALTENTRKTLESSLTTNSHGM